MNKRIYLDVDGVLNCFGNPSGTKAYDIPVQGSTFRVYLNPEHGEKLLQLALDTKAEIVWATMWENEANQHIGPVVGLPNLPFVPIKREKFTYSAGHLKVYSLSQFSPCDKFVFFDDEPDVGAYFSYYKFDDALHIHVEPYQGLQDAHIEAAKAFLA